jgi:transcriptional regulator NrdR family protein
MVCIYCQGDLAVSNSRPQKSRNQTWRRRPCKACGAVFTSIEALDLSQAIIVARSAENENMPNLQPFDRDRLFISIYESLRHRATAASDARGLADTVIAHIIKCNDHGQVDTRTIFETAVNTLKRFDAAAATHYTAFHPQK